MAQIHFAAGTDTGKKRSDNQDSYICTQIWNNNYILFAVIDGVGGYAGGDVAATIAREAMLQYMSKPKGHVLTMLREALVFANNQIAEERATNALYSQMCCVLTAAVANAKLKKLFYVHVGDTRLYCFKNGKLKKLTHDHSMVGIREDAGELNEQEAMQHPRRNEILREVGSTIRRIGDDDFIEYGETNFDRGDLLLACTDGLTDMITSAQITSILTEAKTTPDEKKEALINAANKMGGMDNITVTLIQNGNLPTTVNQTTIEEEKNTTLSVTNKTNDTPPASTEENTGTNRPFKLTNLHLLYTILSFLCISIGINIWLVIKNRHTNNTAYNINTDSLNLQSVPLANFIMLPDSVVQNANQNKNRVLRLNQPDSSLQIQLNSAIVLGKILTVIGSEKYSTILAGKEKADYPAFIIATDSLQIQDTIRFKNLIVKDFKNVMLIKGSKKVTIILENTIFKNIEKIAQFDSFETGSNITITIRK